jgi:hypothetical protein
MSSDFSFSAAAAPEDERFDAWREFSLGALGVLVEPLDGVPERFRAEASARVEGPLASFRYQTDAAHLIRRTPQIARRSWDAYMIHRERGEGGRYWNAHSTLQTAHGALGVGALDLA